MRNNTNLEKKFLLTNGVSIPAVGYGTWQTPDDVRQDAEGLQTMRTIGCNMAWMLNSIKNGNQSLPEVEPWNPTHFIR